MISTPTTTIEWKNPTTHAQNNQPQTFQLHMAFERKWIIGDCGSETKNKVKTNHHPSSL